ncbi:uncharacterized protein LOC142829356 isoform X2 [Pelodiscus sinensis]|uniref:uncharacterized protein LOC142829356 isoform X2 n=1 Tax=Pelodiscus sinensis TaxID=13735 RepID=UPI003F6D8726
MSIVHHSRPCVLSEEQFQQLRAEQSSQEKMRKLYELVPSWDTWRKDQLYQALRRTNIDLVEELEGGSSRAQEPSTSTSPGARGERFVEWHREQLIQRAASVDTVLELLRWCVLRPVPEWSVVNVRSRPVPGGHFVDRHREQLNDEKYQSISTGRTDEEKMQKLYELAPSWERERKDKLYGALWLTNSAFVEKLEGEHFVERHREQLIQRTSSVDTVLEQLLGLETFPDWSAMSEPQMLMSAEHSKPFSGKRSLESPQQQLEQSVATSIAHHSRPCVLSEEQFQQLRAEQSSQEKMRKLYKLVPSWDTWRKDQLYRALRRTNRDLVEELEGGHFVDRHREQLIQRVAGVDRLLLCLQFTVLNDEQYESIRTGRSNVEKMKKLYELVPSWEREHKDELYQALRLTNRSLVEELEGASSQAQEPSTSPSPGATGEHFVERHRKQLIQRASSVDTVLGLLRQHVLGPFLDFSVRSKRPRLIKDLTSEETESEPSSQAESSVGQQTHGPAPGSAAGAAGETSRSQNPTACLRGQDKCGWCAREEEDLPEEVKPESIEDPKGNQETYRVHFSQPGWFRCSETELEFEVRVAVTVQYGYSSWRQHLTESLEGKWMVAGPLFDIRVEPEGAVSAVHLPHFLCLREADRSRVQIAHFLEEGMTLESPTRVRPFHAVLQNPRFSLLGVFWLWKREDTPIHSLVLLYQAQKRVNLTLHLYLIPDDSSRIKAVKDYEKEFQSWCVSKSHFTSRPLCFGTSCVVSSPSEITVKPKELPFLDKPADTLQPFTEIHTKDFREELELSLEEKNKTLIWEAVIRAEDLMPSDSSTKMETDTHFVERHREQLIQRVTAVDSILDSLHGPVLDTEQYERVRAEKTNQDKMRKLYGLAPSWNADCKEQFYQALREKHRYLVEELEGR